MGKLIKKGFFAACILLLVLPGIQFKTGIFHIEGLGGDFEFTARPEFSFSSFKSRQYQKQYERYVNEQFGFREICLRTYNQVWYSLFGVIHARDVIMGKNGCLFELNYILDFTGANFKGEDVIDEQLRKARFVQDTLEKMQIRLVFFYAPGKASFFPENIPEKYLEHATSETNYKTYIRKSAEHGLNYMDMNAYFLSLKNNSEHPLYSNLGIHWTVYGMTLAIDSMLKYMGGLQNAPLPAMIVDRTELSSVPRDTDNDLEKGLNLLFSLPSPEFAYPVVRFEGGGDVRKPSVLTVADSYWWNFFGRGYGNYVFSGNSFWYYNEMAYFDTDRPDIAVSKLDIQAEAESHDFILLLATEANLQRFTYGFIENLYDIYTGNVSKPAMKSYTEEDVRFQEEVIRNNAEWLGVVKEKAAELDLPVDTILRRDAIWMLEQSGS